jgi:hypothetical protein
MEMRDENALRAMLPVMNMRIDSAQGPIIRSRPTLSEFGSTGLGASRASSDASYDIV